MKSVVSISIVLLSLCGCVSPEESEQRWVEHKFFMEGVWYPGTRYNYVRYLLEVEDILFFVRANGGQFIGGDLEYNVSIVEDLPHVLKQRFYKKWEQLSNEEQEEARLLVETIVHGAILKGLFVRGMTLKQVRIALQVPLILRYSSLRSETHTWEFFSSRLLDRGKIRFTFVNGRLDDWSRVYYRRIPPIIY